MYDGELRQKPGMSAEHNRTYLYVALDLAGQLDRDEFEVRANGGHLHRAPQSYFIRDVFVVPTALVRPLCGRLVLESYDVPLPLVIEV